MFFALDPAKPPRQGGFRVRKQLPCLLRVRTVDAPRWTRDVGNGLQGERRGLVCGLSEGLRIETA